MKLSKKEKIRKLKNEITQLRTIIEKTEVDNKILESENKLLLIQIEVISKQIK